MNYNRAHATFDRGYGIITYDCTPAGGRLHARSQQPLRHGVRNSHAADHVRDLQEVDRHGDREPHEADALHQGPIQLKVFWLESRLEKPLEFRPEISY